eukprot:gene10576-12512_t
MAEGRRGYPIQNFSVLLIVVLLETRFGAALSFWETRKLLAERHGNTANVTYSRRALRQVVAKDFCSGGKRRGDAPGGGDTEAAKVWDPGDPADLRRVLAHLPTGHLKALPQTLFMKTGSTPAALTKIERVKASTCAVVGNSGTLGLSFFGAAIDSHDVVFRLNHSPAGGKSTARVGSKTSYRVLNHMWGNRYSSGRLLCRPYQNLCVGGGSFYPEVNYEGAEAWGVGTGSELRGQDALKDPAVMRRARALFYPFWDRLSCTNYKMPRGGKVTLYGFGNGKGSDSRAVYKYFDAGRQTVYR